jgi:hypothetical protein
MLRRLVLLTAAAGAAGYAAWKLAVEPAYREWGVDPDDAAKPLAGDDLVPEPTVVDTRSITIAAPPSAVWPWLVQMGYGRAGWYSYDAIDMAGQSVDRIVPEWQTLAQGDTMPTAPGSGFHVAVLEPERALVLYVDEAMIAAQAEAAKKDTGIGEAPANVRASGAAMGSWFPKDFTAAMALVLEPLGTDATRLLVRYRVRMGESAATRITGPLTGVGIFVMTRKMMLGICDRAERAAAGGAPVEPEPMPA